MNEYIENLIHRENITLAQNWKRAMAHLIDLLLVGIIAYAVVGTGEGDMTEISTQYMANLQIVVAILHFAYQWIFIYKYGATLGKIAMKIRVIDLALVDNPNMYQAMIRSAMRIVSEFFLYFGFIMAYFDPFKRTLHDRVAKTLVIDVS